MLKKMTFVVFLLLLCLCVACNVPNGHDVEKSSTQQTKASSNTPLLIFHSVQEFTDWIESPELEIDAAEDPIYGRDYHQSIYSDTQKMWAVDRYYLLPQLPKNIKVKECCISVTLDQVSFVFTNEDDEQIGFAYSTKESGDTIQSGTQAQASQTETKQIHVQNRTIKCAKRNKAFAFEEAVGVYRAKFVMDESTSSTLSLTNVEQIQAAINGYEVKKVSLN